MEPKRNRALVYGLLLSAWVLLLGWQGIEHFRVERAARAALIERAKDISTTVGIVIRAQRRFGGVISRERLESAMNDLIRPGDLNGLALLNADGHVVASAGSLADSDSSAPSLDAIVVHWEAQTVTVLNLVDLGTNLTHDIESESPTIVLSKSDFPSRSSETNRAENRYGELAGGTNVMQGSSNRLLVVRSSHGEPRLARPPWMSESDYKNILQKQGVHSFCVVMSTRAVDVAQQNDLRLRLFILLLAVLAVVACGLAWRNLDKTAELQLRLVRASELNTHAREMNLAAAGLAHETRNPLNIIRGLAQMISKRSDTPPEIREKSLAIVDQADKVAVQLNEFINYSRPREVRWSVLPLHTAIREVVQALGYDVEEKHLRIEMQGEPFAIEADEQLFRQAFFNLILNAVQAVDAGGEIRIATARTDANEGMIDVLDNGPGVPENARLEIFKPYFTTQKSGTGLGLAIVQQIALAHGWRISCLPNQPRGAIFRIAHLKIAVKK